MRTPPSVIEPEQLQLFDVPAIRAGRRRTRRRSNPLRAVLTVVALGLATAGIMAGSYAAWTAQTTNAGNTVSTGTLSMTNTESPTAVFSATNVVPGQTGSDTVKIKNTGSIPMTVRLTQDTFVESATLSSNLRLSIYDEDRDWCVYPTNAADPTGCPSRGAWNGGVALTNATLLGIGNTPQWAPNEEHTYTLSWELLSSSLNADQGQSASFRLVWDGLQ